MPYWLGRPLALVRRTTSRLVAWLSGSTEDAEWHEALAPTRAWDPDATEVIARRREWRR